MQALSAPPVAPARGPQWSLIKQTILETLRPEQGLVVAPYMLRQGRFGCHIAIEKGLSAMPASITGGYCPHQEFRLLPAPHTASSTHPNPTTLHPRSGMTDSRHYLPLSGGRVYRFQPQRFTRASLATVHGVDERIAGGRRLILPASFHFLHAGGLC